MKIGLIAMVAAGCAASPLLAQTKQFIQAELVKTIKAKSAKAGDPVKARAVNSASLAGGVKVSPGNMLLGEVRAADTNSVSISFQQVDANGKKTPLPLSIRAAMMPSGTGNNVGGISGQTGSVIGMPGVTLEVDDSPEHASKFQSSGKELQLKQGLQFMLAVP